MDVEICRGPGPWGFAARRLRENFVASLFGLLLEGLYLCDLNIWDCVSILYLYFVSDIESGLAQLVGLYGVYNAIENAKVHTGPVVLVLGSFNLIRLSFDRLEMEQHCWGSRNKAILPTFCLKWQSWLCDCLMWQDAMNFFNEQSLLLELAIRGMRCLADWWTTAWCANVWRPPRPWLEIFCLATMQQRHWVSWVDCWRTWGTTWQT